LLPEACKQEILDGHIAHREHDCQDWRCVTFDELGAKKIGYFKWCYKFPDGFMILDENAMIRNLPQHDMVRGEPPVGWEPNKVMSAADRYEWAETFKCLLAECAVDYFETWKEQEWQ
jgi:hypothetical protein